MSADVPPQEPMPIVALSTTTGMDGEYAAAVREAGGQPSLLTFDPAQIDAQLAGAGAVVISGGGDVNPRRYGMTTTLAAEIDDERDAFEIALVRYARERGLPTLCICRGVQVANVAFGGTLVPDLAARFGAATAALHRVEVDGRSERGVIAGHDVALVPGSRLATIVRRTTLPTGSRHHQSLDAIAPDLQVVGTTADGIVEAVEARFASPFWLGVQWHPESTLSDGGASRAIFLALCAAARRYMADAVPARVLSFEGA